MPDPTLDLALTEVLRRWARTTTPEELRARGVREVRSVRMSRVAALIEKAVNRTLLRRTLGSDGGDPLAFSAEAREEFLRLARGRSEASVAGGRIDEKLQERAVSTLSRLREELDERRAELDAREGEDVEVDAAELGRRVGALLDEHAADPVDEGLRAAVVDLVTGEVRAAHERSTRLRATEHRRQVALLERRIAKLDALLGQTEAELRTARARAAGDPGVASIFDAVQGLDDEDVLFERKAALMRSIFEANLELRE